MIDARFIIELQGKKFVLHEGLLDEFHKNGGSKITTELIPTNDGVYLFKATAEGAKGIFMAHGDASPTNVNSMIARHLIRMAETRAVNRALRFYNNIGMCSVDELGGDDEPRAHKKSTTSNLQKCDKCGKDLVLRNSAKGKFYGCSGYPVCKRTLTIEDAEMWSKAKETFQPDAPPDFPLD